METLSYGYFKPETGDKGSVWFPAMEANMERLNDHNHDGTDSALLPPSSISKFSGSISSGSWSSAGGGNYSQDITVPAGISEINNYFIKFYVTSTGYQLHLTWERLTATTYRVYINDNSLSLTAIYV